MNNNLSSIENEFDGIYGKYSINQNDIKEVKLYRFSLLFCSISFVLGLSHWILIGNSYAWIWLVTMAIGIGGSLKWIHIYLKVLHQFLQILWGIGCISILIIMINVGAQNILELFHENKIYLILVGPLFASLTGIGFKEFFCFRRTEAIGVTLFIPLALLGYMINIFNQKITFILLFISSILLLIMSLKKFGVDASADIGDKSVFNYLEKEKQSISI